MTVTRASTGSDVVIVHNDVTQLVQAERGNAEAERRLMLAHERFEANRALAESEERFRKIVDTAIDAIVIIDDQGRIQSLNHAAERIFGIDRREAVEATSRFSWPSRATCFRRPPQAVRSKATEKTARRFLSNFVSLHGVRQGSVTSPVSCVTSPRCKATPREAELTSATATGIGRRKQQPFQLISPPVLFGGVNFSSLTIVGEPLPIKSPVIAPPTRTRVFLTTDYCVGLMSRRKQRLRPRLPA